MKPETPVLPHKPRAPETELVGNGADIQNMRVIRVNVARREYMVSRWSMTPEEKALFDETGELYIWQETGGKTWQPIAPDVNRPDLTFPEEN